MCKLLILSRHNSRDLSRIISSAWEEMSRTERDGFGAAWFSPSGDIRHVKSSAPTLASLPDFCSAFREGKITASDGGALIIHGRTATCGVAVENTHPMLAPDYALVHNGVVSSRSYANEDTTCDSELILSAWRKGGMAEVAAEVSGYYAFGVLSREGGHRHLDVVRDARAMLRYGAVRGGHVFATTDSLLRVAGAEPLAEMSQCTHVSFRDGRHISTATFTPKKEVLGGGMAAAADRALGRMSRQTDFSDWPASTNWRRELAIAQEDTL